MSGRELRDGTDHRTGLILDESVAAMEYSERREGLQLSTRCMESSLALGDGNLSGAQQAAMQRLIFVARGGQLAVERVEQAGFAGQQGFAGRAELAAGIMTQDGGGQFCDAALMPTQFLV